MTTDHAHHFGTPTYATRTHLPHARQRLTLGALLACLVALDWATTAGLTLLGHPEGNPLVRPLLAAGPAAHLGFRIFEVALVAVYARWAPRPHFGLLIAIAVVAIAVSWNLALLTYGAPIPLMVAPFALLALVLTGTAWGLRQ